MINKVSGRNLLIIDDDAELLGELQEYFVSAGNTVTVAENIKDGINHINNSVFDAIVLDVMLPDGEGTSIFAGRSNLPPVIIFSALSDERNIMDGFSLGAQDYVVKPCSPKLLEMRISLRLLPKSASILTLKGLSINSNERTLVYKEHPVKVTGSEFNILWFLMENAGKFFTANEIFENIWGENSLEQTSIKFHISNLRRKLIEHTGKQLIVTEFGKGYTFAKEESV